jgi:hypothetical protein
MLASIRTAARRWLKGRRIVWIKNSDDLPKVTDIPGWGIEGPDGHGLEITILLPRDGPYRFHPDFSP